MEGEKTKMAKRQDSRKTKANGPLKKKTYPTVPLKLQFLCTRLKEFGFLLSSLRHQGYFPLLMRKTS